LASTVRVPWAVAYGLFFLARTFEPEKFLYQVTSRSPVGPEDLFEDLIEHGFHVVVFVCTFMACIDITISLVL
jgi:hypothetical protein